MTELLEKREYKLYNQTRLINFDTTLKQTHWKK